MKKSDFHYDLPRALIAQQPLATRTASRLLCLDGATGAIRDRQFTDLPQLLRAGDLLVFNDTRVLPARLFGTKDSGGRIELLVERLLDDRRLLAQCRASKPPKPGQRLQFDGGASARVVGRHGEFYELAFDGSEPLTVMLTRVGHMPLPPYIARADAPVDRERYQTVWASVPGAVAAPTAGLHFDAALLADLDRLGVEHAFVTLHVGAGTFQPLRVDEIEQHRMHAEVLHVDAATAARVNAARDEGRRVIAVGTTVVRALEAAAQGDARVAGGTSAGAHRTEQGRERMPGLTGATTAAQANRLEACDGETAIFIYPGYRFRVVDALVTNFHLPESTLLMLVCAFAGREAVLRAYRHAVEQRYRFFSYGDAMFVTAAGGRDRANERA